MCCFCALDRQNVVQQEKKQNLDPNVVVMSCADKIARTPPLLSKYLRKYVIKKNKLDRLQKVIPIILCDYKPNQTL